MVKTLRLPLFYMHKSDCVFLQCTEQVSSDEESDPLPRNWSTAQLQIKELRRENKRLKERNVEEILHAMRGTFVITF